MSNPSTRFAILLFMKNVFLYSYEAGFIQGLHKENEQKLARFFNFTYFCLDDVLSLFILALWFRWSHTSVTCRSRYEAGLYVPVVIQHTISLEMPVPSQGHYGFHSFPEFGNFDITLISYFKLKTKYSDSTKTFCKTDIINMLTFWLTTYLLCLVDVFFNRHHTCRCKLWSSSRQRIFPFVKLLGVR
jgi:hypothetical protein